MTSTDLDLASSSNQPGHSKPTIVIKPITGFVMPNFGEVWSYRELIGLLALRDLASRYRHASLGIAWAVIQPLMMMFVLTIVFSHFGKMPSDGVPYPLFSYAAMLLWQYFASAMNHSINSIATSGHLITKVYFPRLVLPLAAVMPPMVDFCVAFLSLIALMVFYAAWPSINVFYLPLFVILTVVSALGAGLWIGTLQMQFRDVHHLVPLITQLWMFASPVIYPLSMVPQQWRWLYELNPMVGAIEGMRFALLGIRNSDLLNATITSACAAVFLLVTGLIYFRQVEKDFADII